MTMPDGIATRHAFGEALVELGMINERVVVLDADVMHTCRVDLFEDAFPGRFFQVGVAEQNMMAAAAGMDGPYFGLTGSSLPMPITPAGNWRRCR